MAVPRFFCDAMLGKLARWLRMFGFDAELASDSVSDEQVLARARIEERVLLTRDKKLASEPGVFLVSSSDPVEQVKALVKEFGLVLPEQPVPNHCSVCNGVLRKAREDELPLHVEKAWVCVDCGQQYWEGAHWKGIKKFLKKVRG
jgi:hypothetical protein